MLVAVEPAPQAVVRQHPPAFGAFQYDDIDSPMVGSAIPGLDLKSPARCAYFGLQYGSGVSNVIYVVFDRDTARGVFSAIYVYSPGDARYGKPFRIKGRRRPDEVTEFDTFNTISFFNGIKASVEYSFATEGTTVRMDAFCSLEKNGSRICRFHLMGICDHKKSVDRPARIERLFKLPEISCRFDNRSSPPKLAGTLKMGRWTLVPDSGMPARLEVAVKDEKNRYVVRENVRLDDEDKGTYRFLPDKRLIPGNEYSAIVTSDLGEFYGKVTTERCLIPVRR